MENKMLESELLESKFNELVSQALSYVMSSLWLGANDIQTEVLKKWLTHKRFEPDLRLKIEDSLKHILDEYKSELALVSTGKTAGKYLGSRLILGFRKEYQNG